MNRTARAALAVLLIGCQSLPDDDMLAAEVLLRRGDLTRTIQRLDRVPAADPRYPDARAIAQAAERRVRTTHELVAEALRLRAEWRDDEAVERFEQALEIWPEYEFAVQMLAATRARLDTLDVELEGAQHTGGGVVLETRPLDDVTPAAPAGETVALPEPQLEPDSQIEQAEPEMAWVAAIERCLERGALDRALKIADTGALPMPPSATRDRLVQLLHQRALVHYGHGRLEFALNDWARLLRIDPSHAEALEFVGAARAEQAAREARR